MSEPENSFRKRFVAAAFYFLARAICITARVRVTNYPTDDRRVIFCGWHGRSLLFANQYRNRGWWVIISNSNDGDIQNLIFHRLGFRSIRGSSKRGGVRAAVEGIRALREGGTMAMTPDGPRGPSRIVQGGVMLMAQKSGARLIPVGISARPRRFARSWDRYLIPLLFARAAILFGEPFTVPSNASENEVEEIRVRLQDAMNEIEAEAERSVGISV